jgi:uncharacterized membrane protein YedE/YeeE
MNEWILNNFLIFIVIVYLAMFGLFMILMKCSVFVTKIHKEAKEKNKLVEFGGVIVGIISIVIALLSIMISYNQNSRVNSLEQRIYEIEKVVKK